jgi:hypothetical protein
MEKKIRIRDEHPKLFSRELINSLGLKNRYLNSLMRIRNLFDPGSGIRDRKIRIRDKNLGSATLIILTSINKNLMRISGMKDQDSWLLPRLPVFSARRRRFAGPSAQQSRP